MRMPQTEPKGPIDWKSAVELIEYAYEHGVNYFDTAYFYHSGESEPFIGKALAKYPRDTWHLADKMPGNFMEIVDGKIKLELSGAGMDDATFESPAGIFELQLERCGVDYFDFYMLHNLCENTYELYTDEKVGIVDYLFEQKKAGRIRHLGISTHARPETLDKFLNWRDCFEYVQMQLNYLDWSLQDADKKYEVLTKHGLPVIVMEPVRGGKLANPGEKAAALLKAARPGDTPASWAFRFLQSLPNVSVVISGMSTMEQLKENIEIFSTEDPMADSERAVLQKVVETMADFVPCTACRYCCGVCPKKLDIPLLVSAYNEALYEVSWYVEDTLESLSESEQPQACTGCGACTPLCPQNIDIADAMKSFTKLLEEKASKQPE
jgi:hypothetical protein